MEKKCFVRSNLMLVFCIFVLSTILSIAPPNPEPPFVYCDENTTMCQLQNNTLNAVYNQTVYLQTINENILNVTVNVSDIVINNTEILAELEHIMNQNYFILQSINDTEIKLNLTNEQLQFLIDSLENQQVDLSKKANLELLKQWCYLLFILIIVYYLFWHLEI